MYIWIGFDLSWESTPVGKTLFVSRPKADNAAGCEESAAGDQMGSGSTVQCVRELSTQTTYLVKVEELFPLCSAPPAGF